MASQSRPVDDLIEDTGIPVTIPGTSTAYKTPNYEEMASRTSSKVVNSTLTGATEKVTEKEDANAPKSPQDSFHSATTDGPFKTITMEEPTIVESPIPTPESIHPRVTTFVVDTPVTFENKDGETGHTEDKSKKDIEARERYMKQLNYEAKLERESLELARKYLKNDTKIEKKAAKAEVKAKKALDKAIKREKKAAKAVTKAQEVQRKAQTIVNGMKLNYDMVVQHHHETIEACAARQEALENAEARIPTGEAERAARLANFRRYSFSASPILRTPSMLRGSISAITGGRRRSTKGSVVTASAI